MIEGKFHDIMEAAENRFAECPLGKLPLSDGDIKDPFEELPSFDVDMEDPLGELPTLEDGKMEKPLEEIQPSAENRSGTVDGLSIADEEAEEPKPAEKPDVSYAGSKTSDNKEVHENAPIQNKQDGLEREKEVKKELEEKYPESEGYTILSEVYLRDKDGKIARDPETGEARRIDFVVVKDGKVVDSIEVTSQTADKAAQSEKEKRIRETGGNYIKDADGNIIKIDVETRIERRE